MAPEPRPKTAANTWTTLNVTDSRATISRPKVSVPVPWNKIVKGRQRNRVMNKNLINTNLINIPLLNKFSVLENRPDNIDHTNEKTVDLKVDKNVQVKIQERRSG